MIRVAICDDEMDFVESFHCKVQEVLSRQSESFEIVCYTDGRKLLSEYTVRRFDIVLLDIDMPDIDGFKVAGKLMEFNEKVIIGFVTSRDDLVFDVFNLNYEVYAFIRKSNNLKELESQLTKMCEKLSRDKESIDLKIFRDVINVRVRDILYFESSGHKVYMYCKKGVSIEKIQIIDKMENVEALTLIYGFVRANSGCIVNPRYIDFIDKKEKTLILVDGKKLSVSRYKMADVIKQFQISRRGI